MVLLAAEAETVPGPQPTEFTWTVSDANSNNGNRGVVILINYYYQMLKNSNKL